MFPSEGQTAQSSPLTMVQVNHSSESCVRNRLSDMFNLWKESEHVKEKIYQIYENHQEETDYQKGVLLKQDCIIGQLRVKAKSSLCNGDAYSVRMHRRELQLQNMQGGTCAIKHTPVLWQWILSTLLGSQDKMVRIYPGLGGVKDVASITVSH